MLISQAHAEKYVRHYRTLSKPLGPHRWQSRVEKLALEVEARHVLDYGCGRRRLEKFSKLPIVNYDPGIPEYAADPGPADLVVCLHVLEHVEPSCVDSVLEHLVSLSIKQLLIVVSCENGSEVFKDGENLHCFVRSSDWWRNRLNGFRELPALLPKGREFAACWP